MDKTITIDGIQVILRESLMKQLVVIDGKEIPFETFFKIAEICLTNTDLRGSEIDATDPRFKFVSVARHLNRVPGFGAGTVRYSTVRYLSMFHENSHPPMAKAV